MTAAAALDRHQTAKASANEAHGPNLALEIFRERCEARAVLCANGVMDLQTAVDELQEAAVSQGLVARHGQDAVQDVMAESFARWMR